MKEITEEIERLKASCSEDSFMGAVSDLPKVLAALERAVETLEFIEGDGCDEGHHSSAWLAMEDIAEILKTLKESK